MYLLDVCCYFIMNVVGLYCIGIPLLCLFGLVSLYSPLYPDSIYLYYELIYLYICR